MSNVETDPDEVTCAAGPAGPAGPAGGRGGGTVEVVEPREVPLGGPRAMTVRRTLPARGRSLVGAWCFVDHYGPEETTMLVAPHPHTGLQTVSWLFTGEITHRDSAGHHAVVRPGELNLMTAGRGISHSEVSSPDPTTLHGVQLWVALPESARHGDPGFAHHVPPEVTGPGWRARVFLGSLLGDTSPVATATPLLGAELVLEPGTALELDLDPTYEHAVLVDRGTPSVAGRDVRPTELAYLPPGSSSAELVAGEEPARVLVLGGPPFGEEIVMWWNFVGRTHEEVVAFRDRWQAQVPDDRAAPTTPGHYGVPVDEPLPPIPAPELPRVRLRSRQ